MKGKAFAFVFICIMFGARGLFAQEAFTWQLALVKDNQRLPFDKTVSMRNGETFSIDLFTEKDCYVYLIVEQASGALSPLLFSQLKAGAIKSVKCTLNPPAGQEKFYIVTSSREQKDLLGAIEAYNRNKSDRNAEILKDALFEVRDSVPDSFAESARGKENEIQGTVFYGAAAYSKTIIISH